MDRTTVSYNVALHLLSSDGHVLPVNAELRYDAADPLAITALFDDGGDEPIRWVFARDLLATGMNDHIGEGDVLIWPTQDIDGRPAIHVRLCSPHGDALLEASADEVAAFLAATWRLVPLGDEHRHMDLDEVVADLLDEA